AQKLGISNNYAELLYTRGANIDNIDNYLNYNEKSFYDPFLLLNMDKAVTIIKKVVDNYGSILVFGDYDADGLTATAILRLFFSSNGVICDSIIPTRDEGYGISVTNIVEAFERKHYDLILTVDCGISNKNEIDYLLANLDTQIIVTDHHEVPEQLPNCLCINAKLGSYPFPYLCGAGVAFKLVQALSGLEYAKRYADLAMVGTIADMMPLLDENRDIVRLGLHNFNHKGLNKIALLSKCKEVTSSDIAMKIAPKINAAGRMGNPLLALDVLLMQDKIDKDKCEKLFAINEQRRGALDEIVAEATVKLDLLLAQKQRLIYLYDDKWKHGLLGIVANRFKEEYNLPTVILTKDGDNYVGSARGIEGIDLHAVFSAVSDCLVKFGGHTASVGFTVSSENLLVLRDRLSEILLGTDKEVFAQKSYYDFELSATTKAEDVYNFTEKLQPILPNSKPILYIKDFCNMVNLFGSDKNHIMITLSDGFVLKGFYNYAKYYKALRCGAEFEALISVDYDNYSKRVCGIIEDLQINNSLLFSDIYCENFISNLHFFDNKEKFCNDIDATLSTDGTLAVFESYEQFQKIEERYDFSEYYLEFFDLSSSYNKTVIISPNNIEGFCNFSNVVDFCNYGEYYLYCGSNVVYVRDIAKLPEHMLTLSINREICLSVFKKIYDNRPSYFDDMQTYFDKLLLFNISFQQFYLCIKIFVELGLIEFEEKPLKILFFQSDKTELTNSRLYNMFVK
ncbi:MAG: DHH family phosphoesterase, partial [Clostridia bacterium]